MLISRHLLCLLFGQAARSAAQAVPSLLDASITDLTSLLTSNTITSVDLVKAYIARNNEVHSSLLAIMELNPSVLTEAAHSDALRANGTILGPLHGLPVLIKDNIASFTNNNTAGSVCMLGSKPKVESTLVIALRKAGAIILGKANMSEWAGARSGGNATIGWSGYGGQCRAAYIQNQCPGGSSGGSAVAVSVGLAPVALGTETDGSIINPSERSHLVGVKPTMGLTSRFGVIPITHRQDTVGPMCKNVRDCAIVLGVLAGKDERDNYTSVQPFDTPPDYVEALDMGVLQGARIGVPWNLMDHALWSRRMDKADHVEFMVTSFKQSLRVLEEAGATIVTANYTFLNASYEDFSSWRSGNGTITFEADMKSGLEEYLDGLEIRPPGINTIEDMINCTKHDPRERYPEVDMESWDDVMKNNYSAGSAEVWEAYQAGMKLAGEGAILGALEDYGVDALVAPSFIAYDLAAPIGAPVVTVPLGVLPEGVETSWDLLNETIWRAPGVPFGVAFFGAPWTEERLLGLAYAFEQRTHYRDDVKPIILPTTELQSRKILPGSDDL